MLVSEILAILILLFVVSYPFIFFSLENYCIKNFIRVCVAGIMITIIISLAVYQHNINASRLINIEKSVDFWKEQLIDVEDEDMERSFREVLHDTENKAKYLRKKFSEKDFVAYMDMKKEDVESD